ncbi:MAG: hypothetical protein ABIJ50_07685 [Pseudomonadota bacterium]
MKVVGSIAAGTLKNAMPENLGIYTKGLEAILRLGSSWVTSSPFVYLQ